MLDFLWGLLGPPFWASALWLIVRHFTRSKAEARRRFFWQWRIQVFWVILFGSANVGMFNDWDYLRGGIVSGILCALLDDDLRKKGKKAAKLLGDKSRQILESMRERMTPQPLPGLSAFR